MNFGSFLHSDVVLLTCLDVELLSCCLKCDLIIESVLILRGTMCLSEPCPCFARFQCVHILFNMVLCKTKIASILLREVYIYIHILFLFWYNICQIWIRKKWRTFLFPLLQNCLNTKEKLDQLHRAISVGVVYILHNQFTLCSYLGLLRSFTSYWTNLGNLNFARKLLRLSRFSN